MVDRPCPPAVAVTPVERLLQVERIYAEPAATELTRDREVLARFPDAEIVEVASHWQIRASTATRETWPIGTASS